MCSLCELAPLSIFHPDSFYLIKTDETIRMIIEVVTNTSGASAKFIELTLKQTKTHLPLIAIIMGKTKPLVSTGEPTIHLTALQLHELQEIGQV